MIEYGMSYCERKGLNTSDLTEAQQTLYYIAENMRMDEKISKDGYEDFQKAIEALEQQPCEDCISREAVDEYITNLLSGYLYDEERIRLEDLSAFVWELPLVMPTRPTGYWIKYQEPWGGMQGWKCSNCKNHYDVSSVYTIIPYNYCPNCGSYNGGYKNEADN